VITEDRLAGYWHPVAWSGDVGARPHQALLLGQRVVVWRDAAGAVVVAADRCPHRGTALSLGEVDERGCIVCPYHGWHFDAAGSCVAMPQLRAGAPVPHRATLTTYCCEERHGLVWVCLADPVAEIPDYPEHGEISYRHVRCAAYRWRTSPERMVENFTDFGHLGYLHDGLLGSRDDLVVPAHRVEQVGGELRYEIAMTVPNANGRYTVTDVRGATGIQKNRYVLTLPYAIRLQCTYEDTGAHRTLFFVVQPHGDGTCTGYCYQSRDFDLAGDDAQYARFQDELAEQDRPVVESQQPAEVPLGPTGELHLPFDRVAVAYRRAMAALVGDRVDAASPH
jgi:vanillate O-demethylase monooxygenase subunit